jgi:hypothetical protein
VKRCENTFILFHFEAKRKNWKQNEQFLEAKQSKKRCFNFELITAGAKKSLVVGREMGQQTNGPWQLLQ